MSTPSASALLAGFSDAYRDVVRFLTRRTGNAEDARELAHDVWVRLAERESKKGAETNTPADLRAYLFTTAQNIAIDHLRKRRLIRQHAALLPSDEPLTPDATESLMYRQTLAIVDGALAELPERTREVFVLHRMQGLGQAELAERFAVSRNTIERDMMIAMDAVQSALQAWHAGGAEGASAKAGRQGRRKSIAALLGVFAMATTGAGVWRWWRATVPQWQSAYATPAGTQATYKLPDGSTVMLDAVSSVEVTYTGAQRTLRLSRGAAFFTAASDADRPFIVHAPGVRVVVVGTRFGVEVERAAVVVQVETGKVRVEPEQGAALDLGPGDAIRLEPGLPPARKRVSADALMSWRNGELVFDEVRLADAVSRLERYARDGQFRVHVDRSVAALPVSGRVNVARAGEWLRALPAALPVRIEAGVNGMQEITAR